MPADVGQPAQDEGLRGMAGRGAQRAEARSARTAIAVEPASLSTMRAQDKVKAGARRGISMLDRTACSYKKN